MGKVIGNKNKKQYILENIIGQGSFGKVYKAGGLAVKQILLLNMPPYLRSSLDNEIKILKSFKHPNIVSLYDVVSEAQYVYLVMEYCEMDLKQYIKKYKLDQKKAIYVLKQIVGGFSQLVEKGIIHRDLKPANILVNSKGEFKLADFGFAKYVDHFDTKILHSIVGTPLYMAPQILKKSKYTTKCDIWSIGYIFFELLVTKVPWTGTNQNNLYNNITKKPLEIPSYVSEWSTNLLKKILVVSQSDRIGWDQLISEVLNYDKNKQQSKQKGRERSSSTSNKLQKKVSENQRVKPEKSNSITVKVEDLENLFELQLLQCFSLQDAQKMAHAKNFKFSVNQLLKVKQILLNFNENFQTYAREHYNLK